MSLYVNFFICKLEMIIVSCMDTQNNLRIPLSLVQYSSFFNLSDSIPNKHCLYYTGTTRSVPLHRLQSVQNTFASTYLSPFFVNGYMFFHTQLQVVGLCTRIYYYILSVFPMGLEDNRGLELLIIYICVTLKQPQNKVGYK